MTQWVYGFGGGSADGDASMKNLLGGKGANLAEMSSLGLPVPPGFTITTEACVHYYANGQTYPEGLEAQVKAGLEKVEFLTGKAFGDPEKGQSGQALSTLQGVKLKEIAAKAKGENRPRRFSSFKRKGPG